MSNKRKTDVLDEHSETKKYSIRIPKDYYIRWTVKSEQSGITKAKLVHSVVQHFISEEGHAEMLAIVEKYSKIKKKRRRKNANVVKQEEQSITDRDRQMHTYGMTATELEEIFDIMED